MFVASLRRFLLPLLTVSAFVVLCQFGSSVSAMCIYNKADVEIDVEFDCGIFCDNVWNTEPNNVYCRAGEAGTVLTGFGLAGDSPITQVVLNVDAHGYVVMTQPSVIKVEVCAYREDDSLAGCQSFNPTS